jgi:hypothetical protein
MSSHKEEQCRNTVEDGLTKGDFNGDGTSD